MVVWMSSSVCMSFLNIPTTPHGRVERGINSPRIPKSHCSNGQKKCSSTWWTDTLTRWVSDHLVPLFSHIAIVPSLSPQSSFACVIARILTPTPVSGAEGFSPKIFYRQTCSLKSTGTCNDASTSSTGSFGAKDWTSPNLLGTIEWITRLIKIAPTLWKKVLVQPVL
jgi:hypothetical protein